LLFAALVTSVLLVVTGVDPMEAFGQMISYGVEPDAVVNILNRATAYALAALAAAIGFRMTLLNIGVEGQYRLAALTAAIVGGAVSLPPGLHQLVMIVVAMAVGGLWAGIAAVLKVTRGISEVISTIMLNFIAFGIIGFLLQPDMLAVRLANSDNLTTKQIAPSGWIPGIPFPQTDAKVYGLILLAVVVGFAYYVVVNHTRFGFDLRASGMSPTAAAASGVDSKRMIVVAMLLSGGVAGLIGLPVLLGSSHHYALDFPEGFGFIGIAIALLGRNHPVGIVFAALLWAFLDESSQVLDIVGLPKELVIIMQATVLLSVVVAYEVVHRIGLRRQQRAVGAATGEILPAVAGR
jgi:general nucleoside transport system permease protein